MEYKTINLAEKIKGLKDKVNGSGWEHILNPYLDSEDFYKTMQKLIKFVQEDKRFTPKMKDWFRTFTHCKYNDVKVIFIGQDPYPQVGVADGISFSCSYTMKEQPSLRHIFNSLEKQYPGYNRNPDLTRWSEQGVLMLNTALTVEINKIGSHYSLWRSFTEHLLKSISIEKSQLIVVLLGKKAQEWKKYLTNHIIIEVEHPAAAAYKGGVWNDQDLFIRINNTLKNQGKSLVNW
jgi:uracil-DNA glycosylase